MTLDRREIINMNSGLIKCDLCGKFIPKDREKSFRIELNIFSSPLYAIVSEFYLCKDDFHKNFDTILNVLDRISENKREENLKNIRKMFKK